MDSKILFKIEVAYAEPDNQFLLSRTVPFGTSVKRGIELSGILKMVSNINLNKISVGIFGQLVTLDTVLLENDRIEIYRPLFKNPKEIRLDRIK